MKALVLIFLLCVSSFAQDRAPRARRLFQPSPTLMTLEGTDNAAGLAQSPYGYPVALIGEPIPAGSVVGLLGQSLVASNATKVLVWSQDSVQVIDAQAVRNSFPGLEMIVFRLPRTLHGEVWISILGRQASNAVKLTMN